MGIILFFLLTLKLPFGNEEKSEFGLYNSILEDDIQYPKDIKIPKEIKNLLSQMLEKNAERRISTEGLASIPIIKKFIDKKDFHQKNDYEKQAYLKKQTFYQTLDRVSSESSIRTDFESE